MRSLMVASLIVVLPCGLAITTALEAQQIVERLTMDQALELFARNNLELQITQSRWDIALGAARASRAFPNPVAHITHETLSGNGQSYSESYFNLNQSITLPWLYSARKRATRSAAEAARFGVGADSNRMVFEMKHAFIEAAAAELRLDVVEEMRGVFRLVERSGTTRYDAGDLSGYDLRRLRIELARYETLSAESAIALVRARRRLTSALASAPSDTLFAPTDSLNSVPPRVRTAELVQHALTARSEVALARAEVAAARATRSVGRAQRMPELMLTGGYKRQSDGLDGAYLSAGLPLPLWDFRGGAVDAAEARLEAAADRQLWTNQMIRADVENAIESFESYSVRTERIGDELLDGTDDLLRVALIAYDEGEMNLLELLDAADAHHSARITDIDLRATLWISYFDLERAVGGFHDIVSEGRDDR